MSFLQFLVSKTDKIIFRTFMVLAASLRMVLNNPTLGTNTLVCSPSPHCTGLCDSTVWQVMVYRS